VTIEGAFQGKAVGQAAVILLAALLGMALTLSGRSYAPGINPLIVATAMYPSPSITPIGLECQNAAAGGLPSQKAAC